MTAWGKTTTQKVACPHVMGYQLLLGWWLAP